jgi:hypothetical protein
MRRSVPAVPVVVFLALAAATGALAEGGGWTVPEGEFVLDGGDMEAARGGSVAHLDLSLARGPADAEGRAPLGDASEAQAAPRPRPTAFEYSDGYYTRLKIHKWASYATLPLFAAQFAVGQKLYNGTGSDSTKSLHGALAAGTGVLFGVNTVTGVWNLAEGRKDPNHRTKRMVHGILMLVADAGFVATGLMAPESEHGEFPYEGGGTSASTHRTVALASMGVATVAYLMMLIH